MRKRFVLFTILLIVITFSFKTGFSFGREKDDFYKELEIFSECLAIIEKKYVDEKPAQDLIYGAMQGTLASLDPFSQFMTPEEFKNLLVETEGKFGGLGIEITMRNSILTIVSPMEDTPAWRAGIKAGDIIIKIDGELTKGITLNDAVKKMRGDPETKVTLTIFREKDRTVKDIEIVRDIIKIKDIKRPGILEDGVGYVKIGEFRETTSKDLGIALSKINKEELKALIIDVRNNPGGLLSSAIDVSSRFLEEGKIVVSTNSRTEKEIVYKSVYLSEKYLDIPIVVLINKGSASGSEILAAALRENNRAILLGETTFGKGSVQTIIPLSDGAALRLTTSKYYTPNGGSIHEKGIDPDVVVEEASTEEASTEEVKEDVFKEFENNGAFDYKKDYQIVRAFDLIKGLLVLYPGKE
ncbi:MAG: S41 family peptidase [Candidatus Omnitrophica bacterium]|nr:S41 family peptidase [Candidatus Omnitrophota bacterium]MCK5392756.1 S41 family peptidase [Candidatus Omnitrophota bacterium]